MNDKTITETVADLLATTPLAKELWSEDQLRESIDQVMHQRNGNEDLWIFAYGSLIWNPGFTYAERRIATLYGYHRKFCLWSRINRGTPERPGLVLALERGGRCTGVAYRIDAKAAQRELMGLWSREMLLGSYHPRWARVRADKRYLRALAFTINRCCSGYAGQLSDSAVVATLRSARGIYGSAIEYLVHTVEALQRNGIRDSYLERLCAAVSAADDGEYLSHKAGTGVTMIQQKRS